MTNLAQVSSSVASNLVARAPVFILKPDGVQEIGISNEKSHSYLDRKYSSAVCCDM